MEERRLLEARQHQREISELQNELRLARLAKEAATGKLQGELLVRLPRAPCLCNPQRPDCSWASIAPDVG